MSIQDEQTFFQRLDELKLDQEHQQKLAQIKATAEVDKEKIRYKQQRLNLWGEWSPSLQIVVVGLAAVVGLMLIIGGIWWMWASSPAATPEEMKQDRAEKCVYYNGTDDKPQYTWYPDAAGGEGLCLPKEAPSPAK